MNIHFAAAMCFAVFTSAADEGKTPKKPSDADITRLLVGKWEGTDPVTGTKGVIQYAKDGTFIGDGTTPLSDDTVIEFHVEGTWSVKDGSLKFTILKSTRPGVAPIGIEVKETIHAIDEKTVRYTRGLGKEKQRTRVKE